MTENAISFLGHGNATQIKLHVIELEKIYSSSFLLWIIFLDNLFLILGSLMNANERELKLSNHDNENVSGICNVTFLQSFLSQ